MTECKQQLSEFRENIVLYKENAVQFKQELSQIKKEFASHEERVERVAEDVRVQGEAIAKLELSYKKVS